MLAVVGGVVSDVATDNDEVIAMLERLVADLKSGEKIANKAIVALVNDGVDGFSINTSYHGRATHCLGYTDIIKSTIMSDILD